MLTVVRVCFQGEEELLCKGHVGDKRDINMLFEHLGNAGIVEFKGRARSVKQVLSGAGVTTVGMELANPATLRRWRSFLVRFGGLVGWYRRGASMNRLAVVLASCCFGRHCWRGAVCMVT
jgi:hypothetical protein